MSNWVLPDHIRTPDFIICGAMKSGTSTLHYILSQHPKVFIPDEEIHFFDIDNVFEHPDFNYFDGSRWVSQRLDDDPPKFWEWYASHFDAAHEDQLVGEDSTTYISSEIAAKRIAMQNKRLKLIILLRHPTDRAYSQYWHLVRTGRATHSFEDTLRYDPFSVLHRSLYLEQLTNFLRHVPREQLKVVVFEEFMADKAKVLRELCEHIGIDYDRLPAQASEAHVNGAQVPRHPGFEVAKNRFFRSGGNLSYRARLPICPDRAGMHFGFARLVNVAHRRINPLVKSKPPAMVAATRQLLDSYFERELDGLNELLGRDVLSCWFGRDRQDAPR
ncbi:sulfotransferase family protein [Frateuria soli]|uniref:sulfotransferase family protein n=1 Tax=Frateuria soli TaxID=1542730 RepID=UPI001E43CF3E|nr:sulfotransferase [Frateuria soli]UGB39514.1 sulfotransferase [Frateuria soli]